MNLRRIIREEMDGLEWIKDVKSNQDIAQEIADETYISRWDHKIYAPSLPKYPFPPFPPNKPIRSFHAYCEERYGLNDDDIKDVWNRYKELIKDKINNYNNLNENNDMEWVKNIPDNQLISSLLIYYSIDQLNLLTDVEKLLWNYRNKRMKSDKYKYKILGHVGTYNENKIKRWNDILKRGNCIGVLQVIYNGKELHMIPIYDLEDYKKRVNEFSKVLENNNYIGIIKPEDLLNDSSYINESNDFDWAKETNPIQCKDLKGYYFYFGADIGNDPFIRKFVIEDVFIKNPIGYGRGNDLDSLKIYYTWDNHNGTVDWNQMECDAFIHRVKRGDYTLYDKNGVKVNPRDLVYTDGTFDDDERKEIWESNELDWIKDIPETYTPKHGDYIEVINRGDLGDFRAWLGTYYAGYYDEGVYGETIKGVVRDVNNEISRTEKEFVLVEEDTYDEIYFPFYDYILELNKSPWYKNLNIEYNPLI